MRGTSAKLLKINLEISTYNIVASEVVEILAPPLGLSIGGKHMNCEPFVLSTVHAVWNGGFQQTKSFTPKTKFFAYSVIFGGNENVCPKLKETFL